jgi:hypothetical protein
MTWFTALVPFSVILAAIALTDRDWQTRHQARLTLISYLMLVLALTVL